MEKSLSVGGGRGLASSWAVGLAVGAVLLGAYSARPRAAEPAQQAQTVASEQSRALSALQEALQKDPTNSELWSHLGFAWHKLADLEQSQKAFEKAVSLNPKNLGAQFMLGLIYEKKKLKAQAIEAWKACLASPEQRTRDIAKNHLHQLEGRAASPESQ